MMRVACCGVPGWRVNDLWGKGHLGVVGHKLLRCPTRVAEKAGGRRTQVDELTDEGSQKAEGRRTLAGEMSDEGG